MPKYIVTVDVPVMVRVVADDKEAAQAEGDRMAAYAYGLMEGSLVEAPDIWLGARYDDTDVGIEDKDGDLR